MNVVDSSAWLEYFADGSNADCFAASIEATDELIVLSGATLWTQDGDFEAIDGVMHVKKASG